MFSLFICFQSISCVYRIPNEKTITSTVYIFHFDSGLVTIKDDYNKIIKVYGGKPYRIELANGLRIIHFNECVILKTTCDSIEPSSEYVRLKGYMGVTSNNTNFTVDAEGIINDDSWHGG